MDQAHAILTILALAGLAAAVALELYRGQRLRRLYRGSSPTVSP